MVRLVIENCYTTIEGVMHPDRDVANGYHEALRKELGYRVPGADWSEKYKQGAWDGIISLYQRRYQRFPTGLFARVKHLFEDLNLAFTVEDRRKKPAKNLPLTYDFGNKELRFYQDEAVKKAIKSTRGMLAIATGGGKTLLSCKLLCDMAVAPVIFFVPSISLLRQTKREFEAYLRLNGKPIKVGMAGDGVCELVPDGVNIITYQTGLAAFNEKYNERSNKIEQDEFAGDSNHKTNEQLKEEFYAAKEAYLKARKAAQAALEDSDHLKRANGARIRLEELEELPPTSDAKVEKARERERKAMEKQLRSGEFHYAREMSRLAKAEKAAFDKARLAVEGRKALLTNKAGIRELINNANALVFDEAHTAAVILETLGLHAPNAYYRIGLSATPWREDNQEVRIEGTLGRKLISISASDLIELGFLVPPSIYMLPIKHVEYAKDYKEAYDLHITYCWERNFRIKQCAEAFKEMGIPTMILVERTKHGDELEMLIKDSVFVPGGEKGEDDPDDEERDYRRRMLNACERNEKILIATQWANVGVDAPRIRALILAGSNKSSITTYQQVGRVLRLVGRTYDESVANGKPNAIVIDFMDEQDAMHEHSNRRKRVYRNERAFALTVVK